MVSAKFFPGSHGVYARLVLALIVTGVCCPGSAAAQTSTAKAIRAIRAREAIRLQLTGAGTLNVAVDNATGFSELKNDQTFTTSGPVAVTFYRLNPLRHHVTVDVTAADDPSHATVAKLIEGLLGVAAALRPEDAALQNLFHDASRKFRATGAAADPGCPSLDEALKIVTRLQSSLYDAAWSGASVKREVKAWSNAIDEAHRALKPGMEAIGAGLARINLYLSPRQGESLAGVLEEAEAAVRALDDKLAEVMHDPTAASTCEARTRAVYQGVRLADPHRRLAEIKRIHTSVTELLAALAATYAEPANWQGTAGGELKHDFIVRRNVEPTSAKMQLVTVKVVALDYSRLDELVPELIARREDLVTGTFSVREYSFFVPEIGAGAIVAYVNWPKYGTASDTDGRTVVVPTEPDRVSVEPTVLVNFVCRCGGASLLTPMIQLGASTSTESLSLLFGGGIRLFHAGRGDFAIAGGWVLPWVRQLKTLRPGDVVEGTAQIEDDLELRPTAGKNWYWGLQYKF